MENNIRFSKLTFNEVKHKEYSKKNKQIFDEQLEKLPKKVIFCKKCVTSNQRPRTEFDDEGVCSACRYAEKKFGGGINWRSPCCCGCCAFLFLWRRLPSLRPWRLPHSHRL